ncbi:uncharacterized protein LOC144611615 isoform X1 [Rhinoraja longicauda]
MGSQKPLLCPWLIKQVDSGQYPGLYWVNEAKRQFRIPWKHCLRQNISADDTKIFEAWATASGRYKPGIDVPNPPVWKRNFRSALARKKHFRRLKDNRSDSQDPHLVYEIQSTDFPEGSSPSSSTDLVLKLEEEEEEEVEVVSEEDMEGEGDWAECQPSLRSVSVAVATVKAEERPCEEPVSREEMPGASVPQGPLVQGAWRGSLHSSTGADDAREGSDRQVFRRRLVQMLGTLSHLSDGVREMGRSLEASVASLAQEMVWGQDIASPSLEVPRGPESAGAEAAALQRLLDRVSTSLGAQEEAIRGLRAHVETQGGHESREQSALARQWRDAAREQAAAMQEQRETARERAALQREQAALAREQRDAAREQAAAMMEQRDVARAQAEAMREQLDAVRECLALQREQLAAEPGRRQQGRPRRAALRPLRAPSSRAKRPARVAAADGNTLELRPYGDGGGREGTPSEPRHRWQSVAGVTHPDGQYL